MKQNKKYKQALSSTVGFDADTEAVETVDHPYFSRPGEVSLAGGQEKFVEATKTRGELEAYLKGCGLSKRECEVVLLRREGLSLQMIALKLGKSREWVVKTLKRVSPQVAKGEVALPSDHRSDSGNELPPMRLKEAMKKAREAINSYHSPEKVEHMAFGLSELNLPPDASDSQKAVAMISLWPRLLLHPKAGPMLTNTLVDLLTSAHCGNKTDAKRARAALAPLTRYRKGNRCPIPDAVLASESLEICVTVAALQRAWRNTGNGQTRMARVEAVREQFALRYVPNPKFDDPHTPIVYDVTDGLDDQRLLSLLQADLLQASGSLAEDATGIAAEAFIRAWRSQLAEEIQSLQEQTRL